MMKKTIIVFLVVLFCASLAQAKTIFVGSHGGKEVYTNLLFDSFEVYNPLQLHWDADKEWLRDAEDVADEYGEGDNEWKGHGVDASVVYYKLEHPTEMVYSMISKKTTGINTAYAFIVRNYVPGDKLFLVGYSAGGKFMVQLAQKLRMYYPNISIDILGLIDPVMDFVDVVLLDRNVEIPDNVENVALYFQVSDPYICGMTDFSFADTSKTTYFPGHPSPISGTNVSHGSIDNDERVWKDLGEKMAAMVPSGSSSCPVQMEWFDMDGDSFLAFDINGWVKDCDDSNPNIYPRIVNEEWICDSITSGNAEMEEPGTPDPTPDIDVHIDKVTASYQGDSNYEHVTNIYLGQEVKMEVDIENKGDEDIHVDIDYYWDDDKSFSFDSSHKVGEDNDVKIEHGTRDNGQPENVIEHKQHISFSEVGTYYLYIKVTTNGDSDESASFNTSEYAKIVVSEFVEEPVTNIQPTGKSWSELTAGEKAAVLQIILD